MKRYKYITGWMLLILGATFYACQDEGPELGALAAPSNVTLEAEVTSDGSGLVTFRAAAQNALTYHYFFGISDSEDPTVASKDQHLYRAGDRFFRRRAFFKQGH